MPTTKNANLSDEERAKIKAIKEQGKAEKQTIEKDKTGIDLLKMNNDESNKKPQLDHTLDLNDATLNKEEYE